MTNNFLPPDDLSIPAPEGLRGKKLDLWKLLEAQRVANERLRYIIQLLEDKR